MRSITGTTLVVVALTATISALLFPIWSYADRSGTGVANLNAGTVNTRWGPLSAADRDFVVRVRLAGLWEGPAGQQAIERAPTPAIKTAGEHLVDGHAFLDARVREVAAQLGMELPTQPNAQQQGFLKTLTGDRDTTTYEKDFATIVRQAHGKVFSLVAQIRANTRNSLVRTLADDANTTVLDHMKVLEATGFVDFQALATSAAATATASPTGPPPPVPGSTPPAVPPVTSSPSFPLPPPASRANPSPAAASPTATNP
ncbi:DUF4142 domain-containing protein [Streptomyces sp. NBC_01465]|uniref:DUF4142 domain-containing protein n=1 Tax=Streptomyces sp. NBC_01465 TaxID=2903878 RepID=UPI002E2F69FF|nr:DUF4142 domain-containing protein [Streptomyces sp. NBC_01465]